ncbi:MAG TPA: SDR family NAD(P)-dependent oxidoreductase [Acidimicrobiales bacterium]|nr:SDR family NAD(P)-dependent oxidoreductase [Acidimicrobiales bacterium]
MDEFEGKVAVVTGAASGIGRALVDRFALEGMRVVLADVERDALDIAATALADEFGAGNVLAVPTDVRDDRAVDALAAATFDRFGAAHVVCNNAGVGVGGLAWTIPADRWRWIVDVNLLSVAHGVRAFVPRMIEQGEGHVVNTASAAGILTGPAMAPYYATKHGVVALSEALYFDLQLTGATDVGVSVLCPEWVRTRIYESERNRPGDVGEMPAPGGEAGEAAPGMRDVLQGLVDSGLDPADVAGTVVDAIRSGRFWITTHPTTVITAQRRWDAIAADGRPTLWDVTAG